MKDRAWIERIKATIGIEAAVSALGLKRGRMASFGPCPLCGAEKRGSLDSRPPAGVGREKGRWHCWACDEGGDVLDLVAAVRLGTRAEGLDADRWRALREACEALGWIEPSGAGGRAEERVAKPSAGRRIITPGAAVASGRLRARAPSAAAGGEPSEPWDPTIASAFVAKLWTDEGAAVLDYLRGVRRFSDETIRAWDLGAMISRDGTPWVAIPLKDRSGVVVNVRYRPVPPACAERSAGLAGCGYCEACVSDRKTRGFRVTPGRPLPLYGSHLLPADHEIHVIVTEGELDVVALYEYGFREGVVSGTGGAGTLKDEWLDELEPYKGFVLAYDQDDAGEQGASDLAERLGRYRCSRARLPRKDAGDCLAFGLAGDEVESAINRSRGMLATEIVGAGAYADDIERLITRPGDLVGRPTGSAALDRALGGIRPGVIIVTGETGEGKTSFLTWLLFEQARMGHPSLLTSFEQSPLGTVQKLLRCELGGDFTARTEAERRGALAELDARPLTIVKHRGQMPFEELHDTIRYAVRRLGVRNVLVDHLGFVVDPDAEDERREIQVVIRALSIIAEHEGVAIFLVCHPSNQHVAQKRRVGIADLKGASALRQDAHEVWVVQKAKTTRERPWPGTWIHLDKIRSDFGASGSSVLLAFDPLAVSYADDWASTPSGRRGVRVVIPAETKPRRRSRPAADDAKARSAGDSDDDDSDAG